MRDLIMRELTKEEWAQIAAAREQVKQFTREQLGVEIAQLPQMEGIMVALAAVIKKLET